MCINPATSGVNRAAPMPRKIAIGPELATCNTVTMPKPQTVTRPPTLLLTHIPTATDPSTQKEPEIIDVRNDPLGAAFGVYKPSTQDTNHQHKTQDTKHK
jgi:hypothetical protein